MRVGRLVFGVLGFLVGVALIAGSASILTDDRDADDFFVSREQHFVRSSHAIASEDVDVLTAAPGWLADWLTDPVDIRVKGAARDGGEIFLGIAETSDIEAYLAGVDYDEVTSVDFEGDDIRYRAHQGTTIPSAPGVEEFWAASVEGPAEQTLDRSLEPGNWSVVMMNGDGSAGIDTTVVFGAKIANMVQIMWIGLAFGVLSVLGGGLLIYRGVRRQARSPQPQSEVSTPPASAEEYETVDRG